MICSSVNRFFTSNILRLGDWTPNRFATQNRGDVASPLTPMFVQPVHTLVLCPIVGMTPKSVRFWKPKYVQQRAAMYVLCLSLDSKVCT